MISLAMAVLATSATVAATAAPGSAAVGSGYVLDLPLNEAAGARTAVDRSGMGHNGTIGSHVLMNGDYAYFDRHSPSEGIDYNDEHMIMIPEAADGSLDPGSGAFSISFKMRNKEHFGNILQKGQSRTVGGQVKFQIPKGKLSCMFKTPTGTATATTGTMLLDDNLWHSIRCDRTPTSVTLYVDGVRVGRSNHVTGTLDNKKPWSIGGKSECDAVTVTCDYFSGGIQDLTMTKGYLPPAP